MSGMDIGIGVVGLGFMGRRYAQFLSRIEGVRLAGVYDLDASLAREVAAEFDAPFFPDLESLVGAAEVAGIVVATPEDRHREPCVAALDAGKPVLVEKPIAHTLEASHAVAAAAARTGTPVLVGHLLRFEPRWVGAWQRIAAGEIGAVTSVSSRRIGNVGDQVVLRGRTSIPLYYGVHDLDVMHWFAGSEATSIYARRRDGVLRAAGYDIDDFYCAVLTFANGVLGTAEIGWHVPKSAPAARTAAVLVIGTEGVIAIGQLDTGLTMWANGGVDPGMETMFWPESYGVPGGAFGLEIRHFAEVVRGRTEPAIPVADAIEALRLSLAMDASAARGAVIDLTEFGQA